MKQKLSRIYARAQNWLDAHWRGDMPRLARIKAWRLSRQGDYETAAAIWRQIAQHAERRQSAADAAVAWTRHGRCILADDAAAAEAAFTRAIELRPGFRPALESLVYLAAEREDWTALARHLRAWHGAGVDSVARVDATRMLGQALIKQGAFAYAAAVIDRLGATADGRLAALELRLAMAILRLDQDEERAVWRDMRESFPAVAARSHRYLQFRGGEDMGGRPLYTADDLAAAGGAAEAWRILAYLSGRLPKTEHLDLYRDTVDRFPAAADMHAAYIQTLCMQISNADELAAARRRARDFTARFPRHRLKRRLQLRAAVAANDLDAAARVAAMPRGKTGGDDRPRPLEIWRAAMRGDWDRAKALDRQARDGRYILALDRRGLDLRLASAAPPRLRDKILLFTCVRNEMLFLPWFLDYYRSIGVDWFFVVDNGSNDGGVEYLGRQKDVAVYTSADKFVSTVSGMRWMNELTRRHGRDNWRVYVDADEQLVAPGIETGGLRGVVDGMRERGEEALPAYMVDTYPADMGFLSDFAAGDDPLAASDLLDPDYFFSGNLHCCFFTARGGARDRLFRIRDKIEKAPITRGDVLYLDNHNTTVAHVSRQCGALLHHKILREALEARKTEHNEWRMADRLEERRQMHLQYRQSGLLKASAVLPRGPNTVAYKDSAQLERLGLIGDFAKVTGNETKTT